MNVKLRFVFPGRAGPFMRRAATCALAALLLVSLLPVRTAWAQQTGTLTGTVTDSQSGEPIPGVNVVIEATQRGASTDASGNYTLSEVESGTYTLQASFVGYATQTNEDVELAAGETTTVDFALQQSTVALEELVTVAYSKKTRRQLTSSVSEVSAEDLQDVTTANVSSMLQGKVPGAFVTSNTGQPGESPEVRIRGTGSITAGASPLYVVDGAITDPGMAQSIPSSDIASATVLKDAAATALYGARAANGVIVISTKSGQAGETQVNISSSLGASNAIFRGYEMMNSRQFYDFYQQMGEEDLLSEDLLSRDTDWMDLAFRRGLASNTHMSVSGSNESTSFFISGGYYTEEGVLVSTGYDRFSGRVNLEHEVTDRFRVTGRVYGQYETRDFALPAYPSGEFSAPFQAFTNLPWDPAYDEVGAPVDPRTMSGTWRGRDEANFLYTLQHNWSEGRYQDYGGQLRLEYDLLPGLSFSTTNRIGLEYDHREDFLSPQSKVGSTNNGELENFDSFNRSLLTSNLLQGSQDVGAHSVSGLLGFEYEQEYYSDINGVGIGIFPGLSTLDVTAEALNLDGDKNKSAFISGFSQVNYDYKDTYFLTGSFRRDGSSRFGLDNRYGNFYSVSGAWEISNESFLEGASALDQLRLRASYGTTGNASIDNFLWASLYSYSVNYNGQGGSLPTRLANPNLTWEVAHTFNVGADVGLFDRVDLSVDVYRRENQDLLQNVELPKTSGFDFRTLNVGSVLNRGLDLALSTINLTGALGWTTDFNVGLNRNEVLNLYENRPVFPGGDKRIVEGRDLNSWYLREWAGVDPENGDPLWEKVTYDEAGNATGVERTNSYSEATLQYVGTSTPDFQGGMRNTLQYEGLSLSVLFSFVYGNEVYCDCFGSDGSYLTFNSRTLPGDWSRWREPGDQATHPKPVPGSNKQSEKPSSRHLEDGSYLQVRNVTLSYTLPATLTERVGGRSAQVYVSGDNLTTFAGYPGMNPAASIGGQVTNYPATRKIMFGVRLGL